MHDKESLTVPSDTRVHQIQREDGGSIHMVLTLSDNIPEKEKLFELFEELWREVEEND